MKPNLSWGITTLALVVLAVNLTWGLAGKYHQTPTQPVARGTPPADEPIKLLVAYSRPLAGSFARPRADKKTGILELSELSTAAGRPIEVEWLPTTSQDMVEGVLNGSLKAHILIPASGVFLDLADREWSLRTGKPLLHERTEMMHQPHVLAVRRPMAEALGWPGKEITWSDVVGVAREGWKSTGHPEWGTLKLLLMNPEYSDAGLHAMVSVAHGILGKQKGLTSEDIADAGVTAAFRSLDGAVVWYASSCGDLFHNEALEISPQCHMTFVPEHLLVLLNEHSARRKAPPEWIALYPRGSVIDNVAAGVVRREWVTDEHREAGSAVLKRLREPETQKRLMALGYRPALSEIALAPPLAEGWGIDPKRLTARVETPQVEVVLDCLSAWQKVWKSRTREVAGTGPILVSTSAPKKTSSRVGSSGSSHITPVVQCVRRARPSTVFIDRVVGTREFYGTGVVVDARGYVVTNHHVVSDSKEVTVRFVEAESVVHKGEVVWDEPDQDIAVVRILTPGKYPVIGFANSEKVEVGESVVAIGNPYGYTGTVTLGIISALDREITTPSGDTLKQLIQTDASINPGNSGGPLLNVDGELIGINVAHRQEAQGISFAIPSNRVHDHVGKALPKSDEK
jgi:S1-C subfamily serine protease